MAISLEQNLQLNSEYTADTFASASTPFFPQPVIEGGSVTIVTTINGAGGPDINFTSAIGFAFSGGSGGNVVMSVSNAALVRSSIGAAASGVNTDITQLNGASQVDVSSDYKVAGVQVVAAQQPAIPNPVGGVTVDVEGRAATDLILAAMRAHGLIVT